ncbi:MAG: hypothetical protein EAX86_03100 [Candidatus Heimdallarchaeota archaeon]|nr:hypothetical protein [Candidatus Heimdallarchaeota archaeon]
MPESQVCYICGLKLIKSNAVKVRSFWKISCPENNWSKFLCNKCAGKIEDFPCSMEKLKWLKIRVSEENEFHQLFKR